MKMTPADIKAYPKLAYYVKKDLPEVVKVPAIRKAMLKVGQLTKAKLTTALKWGQGPQIRVMPLVGAYGEFTPNKKSNEIRIDVNLVKNFESGKGIRKAAGGNVYLVGVTLLHELIHWGDDQNGIDRPGEEGAEFEKLIYGKVIH